MGEAIVEEVVDYDVVESSLLQVRRSETNYTRRLRIACIPMVVVPSPVRLIGLFLLPSW